MAFTIDGKRNYKCKRCGKWIVEDLKQWNSKPQTKKNGEVWLLRIAGRGAAA